MNVEVRELEERPAVSVDDGLAFAMARMQERVAQSERFFEVNAQPIAACAAAMADRFFAGATLLVFGSGPHATDAQHNAVEFVHPVLPGCRALAALSLSDDVATVTQLLESGNAKDVYARQVRLLGQPGDIALAFAHMPLPESIDRGLAEAASRGLMTVALTSGPADVDSGLAEYRFNADDPDVLMAHELHLGTYHMLWELVHIVLNHRGIGAAR